MDMKEIKEKLAQAQMLLSEVYHFACENDLDELEDKMSMADTMVVEGLEALKPMKTFRVLAKMTTNYYMDVIASTPADALSIAKGCDLTSYEDKEMVDFYVDGAYLRS